jgi:acyl-CoA thioesterase-1
MRTVFVVWTLLLLGCQSGPLPKDGFVVALGASITAGYGILPSEAYPAQLELLLRARGLDIRVINAGISGDSTDGMLGRISTAVPEGTRLVILQAGDNDKWKGVGAAREQNIERIKSRLSARHIKVWVLIERFRDFPRHDGVHLTAEGSRQFAESIVEGVIGRLKSTEE